MSVLSSMETAEYEPVSRYERRTDRESRLCGLLDMKYLPYFEVAAPDDEELTLFDQLCDKSDGGWLVFRENAIRVDHYMENGNEIRSVVETHINSQGELGFVTSNLIKHSEKYYLEIHSGRIDDNGDIWEPAVGSPDVSPAPHGAFVVHYQVAYEAAPMTTLPRAA